MTTSTPSRIDERALGAGTNARFVLLIVLLLMASGAIMIDIASGLTASGTFGCRLAAGIDPNRGTDLETIHRIMLQEEALDACLARFERKPPAWLMWTWPVVVIAASVALFRLLPRWKTRGGRTTPLANIDPDGKIHDEIKRLAERARIRPPRIVVDNAAVTSSDAIVFGSDEKPIVRLDLGLLKVVSDRKRFDGVLLHEFAHIGNRDVTVTYATVAMWRVFVVLVLLPGLVQSTIVSLEWLRSPYWESFAPTATRSVVLTLFLVLLVSLARSDVLRSREHHADLAAHHNGADAVTWADGPSDDTPHGLLRKTAKHVAQLWSLHPEPGQRRRTLTDPEALFGLRALPMFLTGTAVTYVNVEFIGYLKGYGHGFYGVAGPWQAEAFQLFAWPGLISALVGVMIWRAVAYAVVERKTLPSGPRAGLWLGTGMAVTELMMGQATINQWLPARPWILLLLPFVAACYTWWITECAELWTRTWNGSAIRPLMRLNLVGATVLFAAWLVWWQFQGVLLTGGVSLAPDVLRRALVAEYPDIGAEHPFLVAAAHVALSLFNTQFHWPLAVSAATAASLVPLLAWALRGREGRTEWVREILTGDEERPAEAPPPLRRILVPGLLGGLLVWAAHAGVQRYLHTWPAEQHNGLYLHIYLVLMLFTLVGGAGLAATVAAARVPRFRLPVALIAAQIAMLVGYGGIFALASTDGCVEGLTTLRDQCVWTPSLTWYMSSPYLALALILGTMTAVMLTAIVSAVAGARPKDARGKPHGTRARVAVGAFGLGAIAVAAALVITAPPALSGQPWAAGFEGEPSTSLSEPAEPAGPSILIPPSSLLTAPSPSMRAFQVAAWRDYGGAELLGSFGELWGRLTEAMPTPEVWAAGGTVDLSPAREVCVEIARTVEEAEAYFEVPDPDIQPHWRRLILTADAGARSCVEAADARDREGFLNANALLVVAAEAGLPVYEAITR